MIIDFCCFLLCAFSFMLLCIYMCKNPLLYAIDDDDDDDGVADVLLIVSLKRTHIVIYI